MSRLLLISSFCVTPVCITTALISWVLWTLYVDTSGGRKFFKIVPLSHLLVKPSEELRCVCTHLLVQPSEELHCVCTHLLVQPLEELHCVCAHLLVQPSEELHCVCTHLLVQPLEELYCLQHNHNLVVSFLKSGSQWVDGMLKIYKVIDGKQHTWVTTWITRIKLSSIF
jgi:hypothetical protein